MVVAVGTMDVTSAIEAMKAKACATALPVATTDAAKADVTDTLAMVEVEIMEATEIMEMAETTEMVETMEMVAITGTALATATMVEAQAMAV